MKVKDGDTIEFLAISWNEPQWDFDYPCVVLKPIVKYSPSGEPPQYMIEQMAIALSCGDDIEDDNTKEEFEWRGWKLNTLNKVARHRFAGQNTWTTKIRSVLKQKILFFEDDGEIHFKVLENIER